MTAHLGSRQSRTGGSLSWAARRNGESQALRVAQGELNARSLRRIICQDRTMVRRWGAACCASTKKVAARRRGLDPSPQRAPAFAAQGQGGWRVYFPSLMRRVIFLSSGEIPPLSVSETVIRIEILRSRKTKGFVALHLNARSAQVCP